MAITWNLDEAHSEITFKVRHMMISNVKGSFKEFSAQIVSEDEDFKNAKVNAEIQLNSIDTNNADRDEHLKKAEFFNTEKNPVMSFAADSFSGAVSGQLTLNCITKPVTLDVDFGGIVQDPYGRIKAGFSFQGTVKRSEFGISWNSAMETGGVMLGEDVKISGELQFVKA